MSSPVTSPTQSGATPPNPLQGMTGSTDPLANEQTFLKLLVSQLQNQDPMNPPDTNQFVSQLTGYSQLEQMIGIHTDSSSLAHKVTGTGSLDPAASTTPTNNTNTNNKTGN